MTFTTNPADREDLAVVLRGGLIESVHAGQLVMLNSDSSVLLRKGNIEMAMYARSSLKSLQASAMVRNGLKLRSEQLALVCASHSGTPMHLDIARSILADCGLDDAALQNTPDRPLDEVERRKWGVQEPTSLAQNCSGKHSGMLHTCVINGWDTATYRDPHHPLQVAIREEIETMTGEAILGATVDGCGAPLFATSTLGLARAFHRLTTSNDPVHQEVIAATRLHPAVVAGEGRLTTNLVRAIPGLFMKEGAEGVEVLTLPDGRTLVFKISDGSSRAHGPIVGSALRIWGVEFPDVSVPVLGHGEPVGSIESLLERS